MHFRFQYLNKNKKIVNFKLFSVLSKWFWESRVLFIYMAQRRIIDFYDLSLNRNFLRENNPYVQKALKEERQVS